jgi:hypothetical protein
MSDVEQRLTALEAAFAEVKKQKGIQGPRGPAGDIVAAINNAREATQQDLANTLKKSAALHQAIESLNERLESRIREVTDQMAATLRQRNDDFKTHIEDEVAAITLRILKEYWVLDSECQVLDHLQRPPVKS